MDLSGSPSQWLQQRNFQTMDLEDPASRSTSSSSSKSASSSESLFAFFDPSSSSALFSSSSCASQSSAAAAVSGLIPLWTKIGILRCGSWVYSSVLKTSRSSVLSCHGAVLCCTEQSVQSADSRDSTGRLDKNNVPQTKSVRTRPIFFSMDLMEIHRSIALLGAGPARVRREAGESSPHLQSLSSSPLLLLFHPFHSLHSSPLLYCSSLSLVHVSFPLVITPYISTNQGNSLCQLTKA